MKKKADVDIHNRNEIVVKVVDREVKFVIDTGADCNLIDQRLFEKIKTSSSVKLLDRPGKTYKTANDGELRISGVAMIPIEISGGGVIETEFCIAENLIYSGILGNKFLDECGAIYDFKKQKLILDYSARVRIENDVVLPALAQTRVWATVPLSPGDFVGLLSCDKPIRDDVLVAACVVSVSSNSRVPVMMINTSDKEIKIRKGEVCGIVEKISPHAVSQPINNDRTKCWEKINNVQRLSDHQKEVLENLDSDLWEIDVNMSDEVKRLICEYADVFSGSGNKLGHYDKIKHVIKVTSDIPIRAKLRRQAPALRVSIREQVKEMMQDRIIRESKSPYASGVVIVRKPCGKPRFCADFRGINSITVHDSFPIPNAADLFDTVGDKKPVIFSSLDVFSAYWQIEMEEESKKYTAFITADGLYEFNRCPFGLVNSGATFCRAMSEILRHLEWDFLVLYLDDVVIFSSSVELHLSHLQIVLDRFRQVNVRLKTTKCRLFRKSVKFLGHVLSSEGIQVDPGKTQTWREYPVPKNVKQVRSFIGGVSYYRKFIRSFSVKAYPLHNLLKQNVKFVWSEACQKAFECLRDELLCPPILSYPDFQGPEFLLQTDACHTGLGYMISQVQDGGERIIAFGARSTTKAERSYGITDLEALGVIEGVKHFHSYLFGRRFTVVVDHQPLIQFFKQKIPAGRNARWIMLMSQYEYDIVYKPGLKHSNIDTLSRIPDMEVDENVDSRGEGLESLFYEPPVMKVGAIQRNQRFTRSQKKKKKVELKKTLWPEVEVDAEFNVDTVKLEQKKDVDISAMIKYLDDDILGDDDVIAREILLSADQYIVDEEILYRINKSARQDDVMAQLVIPRTLIATVLKNMHDDRLCGHLGMSKTIQKIAQRFTWKNMNRDIKNYILSCKTCAERKTDRHKELAPLIPLPVVGYPFERVSVDFLGPLITTKQQNKHVLCFTDHYSRFPIFVATKDTSAQTVATALWDNVITMHGCPRYLLSDRGAGFMSELVREVCTLCKITKLNTSSYHPACNGLQERGNSTLLNMLSHYVNLENDDWDVYLQSVAFAVRSSVCNSSVGYTPFYLLFGREPVLPIETAIMPTLIKSHLCKDFLPVMLNRLEVARETSRQLNQLSCNRMKEVYDCKIKPSVFEIGDCVYLFVPSLSSKLKSRKLARLWTGPWVIVDKTSAVNVKLKNLSTAKVLPVCVNVNRLKLAFDRYERPSDQILPDDPVSAELEEDQIEPDDLADDDIVQHTARREIDTMTQTVPIDESADAGVDCTTKTKKRSREKQADAGDREFIIEKIYRGRVDKSGKTEYFVKWKGYTSKHNSWEGEENLNFAAREFLKDNPVKIRARKLTAVNTVVEWQGTNDERQNKTVYGGKTLTIYNSSWPVGDGPWSW